MAFLPRPILLLAIVSTALTAGCHTRTSVPKPLSPPAPTYVSNPRGINIENRTAELQQHGYTKEAAEIRARKEAAQGEWQTSGAEAAAYERAVTERREANAKMEKTLSKMEREAAFPP